MGRLKIGLSNEEGENRLMWFLNQGCVISCFRDLFYQEAVATERTEIVFIKKEFFFRFIRSNQDNLDFFLDQLYKKYQYCINILLTEHKSTSKVRVYKLIHQLGKNYGQIQSDQSILVKNFLTRMDMASITGVHRSNIIKYLSELENMAIIKKEKQFIIIKQPQTLEKLINLAD
ncbi:Crp/Fnr family transcriptional regulator [Desulfitobacterium chlororespirans]|uniref:Crp/Fnr family transcriptional regulator n=1 Tax=Desulfitobacterium chlororespirans TaxID=51616 RepID=UPI001A9A4FBE|nr:Crp/Fnr family transcriptional regulator [Desulfitobacterium chlororespirans]